MDEEIEVAEFRTLTEIVKKAKQNLSKGDWDYLTGAADTEASLRRNRAALESWVFRPRVLNNVHDVQTSTELLGVPLRIPVIMPPIGSVQAFDPSGGSGVAEAASEFGILQILSSACAPNFEKVASAVQGPRVYQLYLTGDETWMDDIIERSLGSGYIGFCLTADTQVYSRRERDILKGYVPMSGRLATVKTPAFNYQTTMSWETVAHIKEKFDIPLMIKGVMDARDAVKCVEAGVDVVYVSNHGGRQLDHTKACIDALPDVVEAVGGRVPVVVDGGFLRGADVVKALCLGASAVGMGRFEGFAMAAGGSAALVQALKILEHEIQITMALLGVRTLDELTSDLVERAEMMAPAHVTSAFPFLAEGY